MDILTHTLSGLATATVVASFSDRSPVGKGFILLAGAIGGAFPDIDAISMWSKFDETFGTWFNLPFTGREIYSMKLWYSHHSFFHSLPGAVLMSTVFTFFLYLPYLIFRKAQYTLRSFWMLKRIFPLTFFGGYLFHRT